MVNTVTNTDTTPTLNVDHIIRSFIDDIDLFFMVQDINGNLIYINDKVKGFITEYSVTSDGTLNPIFEQMHSLCDNYDQLSETYQFLKSNDSLTYRDEMRSKVEGQFYIRTTRPVKSDDGMIYRMWIIRNLTEMLGDDTAARFSSEQMKEQAENNAKLAEELFEAREEMKRLAHTDPLTSLMNRRAFMEANNDMIASLVDSENIHVIMMDIDHFKKVNDTYGHATGDECIITIANILREYAPEGALTCRMGGEEFSIAHKASNVQEMMDLAEKIRARIEASEIKFDGNEFKITTSFGVAEFRTDETVLDHALDRADRALYQAKGNGRNQVWEYKD